LTSIVVRAQAVPPKPDVSDDVRAALMNEGQLVYGRDCAECHAEGGVGAVLGGNKSLADKDRVITRILLGTEDGAMANFGPSLTDREIAAVSTFIRNTWDNAFGAIAEPDVKRVREALAKKK
jgi:mono/diheme cytochrome c family protein